MEFVQVDVFADEVYGGNPLAVFLDAEDLSRLQMQAIAREMNLSESAFVIRASDDSYDVRIFTPAEELAFAGHPTIGTAWVLRHLERVKGDELTQHTARGQTALRVDGDCLWFTRSGAVEPDLDERAPDVSHRIARALGIGPEEVELEARELGRSGRLRPAFSDAGLRQLMVPVRDVEVLSRCRVPGDLEELARDGVYCFTALQAGRVRARGLFPGFGVPEDPGTGSAGAALGLYLADRIGPIGFEIVQGVEIARPSRIFVKAEKGSVEVGGKCHLVLTGRLERLP
ncbi:MAG: PhzF family phenazine biosynthesis protein [Actinomycetota bacterium]